MAEPWGVRIYDAEDFLLLSASITRTRTTVKRVGGQWEGRAVLSGTLEEHGNLPLGDSLLVLSIFLLNREDDPEADYWYVDEEFLVVRVEPQKIVRILGTGSDFTIDTTLGLDITSSPDGMSERDVAEAVMDFIFSDFDGVLTDDGDATGVIGDD